MLKFVPITNQSINLNFLITLAPAGIFSGGSEVHQGRACKGGRRVGGSGAEPPDAGEVFKKFVKKSMKNLQFLKNFQENLAIFSNFFVNFIEFLAKIRTKI